MPRKFALLLLLAADVLTASPASADQAPPESACATAAAAAERQFGLPAGLLLAIGRVESGRSTPLGRMPWPWSINAEGADTVTDSAAAAISAVRAMQARGIRSIDTGCFQINLMFHPEAFATLEQAFDPAANAEAAARFLLELHARRGDWGMAVADYHSATPWRGEGYRQLVWRAWTGSLLPDASAPAREHAATGATDGFAAGMRMFGIRVYTPSQQPPSPGPAAATQIRAPVKAFERLPTVFRPSGLS